MHLRVAEPSEFTFIFQEGYKEWPKDRTFEQYVKENSKEDQYGTRYVYVDEDYNIVGSLIVLSLKINHLPIHGIGSVVVSEPCRGKGYGKQMVKECIRLIEEQQRNVIWMLFSEIDPDYYRQFGFKELPKHLQKDSKSVCMVRASDESYLYITSLTKDKLPAYF